ncbi:DUF6497 family protein [Roseobacteraceae bacterium S113]
MQEVAAVVPFRLKHARKSTHCCTQTATGRDGLTGHMRTSMMIKRKIRIAASGTTFCRAAPAGGAPIGGWGCLILILSHIAPGASHGGTTEAPLAVPSARDVHLIEYLVDVDEVGPVLRARYHAPQLEADADIDQVLADMEHLCEAYAVNSLKDMSSENERVIVSMSSQPLEFGTIDAETIQFFEAYRVENGRCIWEMF